MAGVRITSVTATPFQQSAHLNAVFSDGTHLAVFYNGSALVYTTSSDGGVTWSTLMTLSGGIGLGGGQIHADVCQNGNTVYGAWLNYDSTLSTWEFVPFSLAYASGSVTTTLGAVVAVAGVSVGTYNPDAGGTELSVAWDSDHTLYHVGVRTIGGLCVYAVTPSTLTVAFALTSGGPTTAHHSQPIIYVPSGGSTGTLWQGNDGNSGGYPLTVASLSVTASAYGGAWSGLTSVANTGHGSSAIGVFLDTTQTPSQPGVVWTDGSGAYCATYNGTSWSVHTLDSSGTCYGGAAQCVGADLWVSYIGASGSGLHLIKRLGGTWQSSASVLDSSGDRSGWTALNQVTGALLLIYNNDTSGNAVYAARFLFGSVAVGGAGGLSATGTAAAAAHVYGSAGVGGAGGLVATATVTQTAPASLAYVKQQLVLVYNAAGAFIDVWRDAPLLAGVKYAINSATSPIQVKLPRAFDNFDEAGVPGSLGSIGQGNIVKYYVFGPGLPASGLLRFQGVIDAYAPEITEAGEESVTVTLTPLDAAVGDNGILGGKSFGTPAVSASYVDPVTMFNWWFTNNDPLTGLPYAHPLTLAATNPASSGVTAQYTFENQQLGSIFETIRLMLPANWFWRVNPDASVTLNVAPTTAQHTFVVGQHVVAPQYKKDWTQLKNVVQVVGTGLTTALTGALLNGNVYTALTVAALPIGLTVGQQLTLNDGGNPTQTVTVATAAAAGATSVTVTSFTANGAYPAQTQVLILIGATTHGSDLATYGKRVMQVADNRVTDAATAATLATGYLTAYDQVLLRTRVRVVDYRGDLQTGIGYDIETIEPGDTCIIQVPSNITPSSTLWDVSLWDQAYWDYAPGGSLQVVAIITAVTYCFDYVDLEIAALGPSQTVNLMAVRQRLQDFTLAAV